MPSLGKLNCIEMHSTREFLLRRRILLRVQLKYKSHTQIIFWKICYFNCGYVLLKITLLQFRAAFPTMLHMYKWQVRAWIYFTDSQNLYLRFIYFQHVFFSFLVFYNATEVTVAAHVVFKKWQLLAPSLPNLPEVCVCLLWF